MTTPTTPSNDLDAAAKAAREMVDFHHSYRQVDNRYPRDFWHVKAKLGDIDTGWISYGKQQHREQVPAEKAAAEEDAFQRIWRSIAPVILAERLADKAEIEQLEAYDWSDLEDDLADVIGDSMDMDWTSRIGARAVVEHLKKVGARAIQAPEGGASKLIGALTEAVDIAQGRAEPARVRTIAVTQDAPKAPTQGDR